MFCSFRCVGPPLGCTVGFSTCGPITAQFDNYGSPRGLPRCNQRTAFIALSALCSSPDQDSTDPLTEQLRYISNHTYIYIVYITHSTS